MHFMGKVRYEVAKELHGVLRDHQQAQDSAVELSFLVYKYDAEQKGYFESRKGEKVKAVIPLHQGKLMLDVESDADQRNYCNFRLTIRPESKKKSEVHSADFYQLTGVSNFGHE
jgi:hypothetical protein